MNVLHTVEEFENVVKNHDQLFLLKHSSTCPISQAGYEEYETFLKDHQHIPAYYLVVQDARPLSNYIAETYNIKHESPQVFLFSNGNVVYNASHWKITAKDLEITLQENQ